MTARTIAAPAGMGGAIATIVGISVAIVVAIVGSHSSIALFVGAAAVLVAIVASASLRWPRPVLVAVTLSPILDRYLVPGLLAPDAETLAHFLSEALLATVGMTLLVQAARRGTLRGAINHPTMWLAMAFVASAVISAVFNAVPGAQAVAGIAFTVDAVALFLLARIVGFGARQALVAIGVVIGLVLAAAVIAIGQALLTPYLFGLSTLSGRFGELYRLAAFFGDPNVFAAFLSAAIPFAILGASGLRTPRGRRVALAGSFLLALALWLSFSRGGWFGAVGGFVVAGLILDWRALRLGVLVMAIALGAAVAMPRNLLCEPCRDDLDLLGSTLGRIDTIGQGRDLRTLLVANALPIVGDHPVLGVGPGRYGGAAADIFGTPIYVQYQTDRLFIDPAQRTVDNFWLHLLVEAGILGLILYIGMVVAALRPVIRAARTSAWGRRVALAGLSAAVIGLSLNGLTTMLLEANSAAFLFWFLLGIGSQLVTTAEADPSSEAGAATLA